MEPNSEFYGQEGRVAVDTSLFEFGEDTVGGIFVRFSGYEKAILIPTGSYELQTRWDAIMLQQGSLTQLAYLAEQ